MTPLQPTTSPRDHLRAVCKREAEGVTTPLPQGERKP